jgi:hypothetical protein
VPLSLCRVSKRLEPFSPGEVCLNFGSAVTSLGPHMYRTPIDNLCFPDQEIIHVTVKLFVIRVGDPSQLLVMFATHEFGIGKIKGTDLFNFSYCRQFK